MDSSAIESCGAANISREGGPKMRFNILVPLIGMNVAQETTRSQALPGNALVWRLLPPELTGCLWGQPRD
jgi:hypothetical protein